MILTIKGREKVIHECPDCGSDPFNPYLNRKVWSWWRRLLGRNAYAVICQDCKKQ